MTKRDGDEGFYRLAYGGREPDYDRCCVAWMVPRTGLLRQCRNKRGYGLGEAYCKFHAGELKNENCSKKRSYAARIYGKLIFVSVIDDDVIVRIKTDGHGVITCCADKYMALNMAEYTEEDIVISGNCDLTLTKAFRFRVKNFYIIDFANVNNGLAPEKLACMALPGHPEWVIK